MADLHKENKVPTGGKEVSLKADVSFSQAAVGAAGVESQEVKKRNRRDSVAGWMISMVVHGCLLLSFMGISWYHGAGSSADEMSVGISEGPAQSPIGMGQSEQIPLPSSSEVAAAIPLVQTNEAEAVLQLDFTATSPVASEAKMDLVSDLAGSSQVWEDFGGGVADSSGGGGASFFGLAARGGTFVYVVDRSGSMTGEPLHAAKAELMRSVSSLDRGMKYFIFFYNTTYLSMDARGPVRATSQNRTRYLSWIQEIQGEGGTDPTESMLGALAMKPDVIWLLSDGLFDESACDTITKANSGGRTQIHTISFYNNAGEALLERIAEENRGRYRFVAPPNMVNPRRRQ